MKKFTKKQYIRFGVAAVLYGLFILWMQSAWLLLGLYFAGRYFPDKIHSLGRMEECQESALTECVGMGRRYYLCFDSSLFHQCLYLPELSDSQLVAGEVAVGGRLPVCEQIELRAACTEHAHCLPVGAEHAAHRELQVLSGLARMGLQAGERARTGETGRHRGV